MQLTDIVKLPCLTDGWPLWTMLLSCAAIGQVSTVLIGFSAQGTQMTEGQPQCRNVPSPYMLHCALNVMTCTVFVPPNT